MIIAEIGQAHDGSLGILHSYIDALAKTGVDAVKFQTHIAEAESSMQEPFRINFSYEDASRFDYWKRMEFTQEQWVGIKKHCEEKKLLFISSPFSNAAVDLLESVDINYYKIGSGEVSNYLLLKKIAATNKPVILSSGMSDWNELDCAVSVFDKQKNNLSVLQCTSAYPCLPEQWGLNIINEIKKRYGIKAGFSDHSGDIYACLAAAALGAELFEFHVVFHKNMFGPDTAASVKIDDVPKLVEGVNQIKKALQHPIQKAITPGIQTQKDIFEKSLAINQFLPQNTIIEFKYLEAKKPAGHGIAPSEYKKVIGKKLRADKEKWSFLNYSDLEEFA